MKIATIVGLACFALLALVQPVQQGAAAYAFVPPNRGVAPPPRATNQGSFLQVGPFAGTTFTGKFVYVISITVKSVIPSSDVIACTGTASTSDASFTRSITETASVAASRTTGSASCTVTIPYSWTLSTASSDVVNLGYSISAPATGSAGLPNRFSDQSIAQIHVPANGSTTTETIHATI
ncbi:MAG: hypothetical protein JOY87_04895 [Candidatus Eremiobacteraeota bacterium]|nr:hypothetical protein [Candidatus Eremiobacteraeota bacterium]